MLYRIQFTGAGNEGNLESGLTFNCDIEDTMSVDTNEQLLEAGGVPCLISVIDNDESKFTPIRAKQVVMQFLSTANHNLNTFITDSPDNRFRVHVYSPAETIFRGYLVLNDLTQEFRDDFTYRTVELTATDGIGLLKDIPLTDDNDKTPKGYFTVIQFISWCLKKTGLTLPINVVNNLRLASRPEVPIYHAVSMHAKSFEDEIGTCIDCYAVLEQILGYECCLTQWKGEWWIRRTDEYEGSPNYVDRYDAHGNFIETKEGYNWIKEIGLDKAITLIEPAALVSAERPHKKVELTYNYEYPREIIDNIDFSRGGLFSIVDVYQPLNTFANVANFPAVGEPLQFYRATSTGLTYIWSDEQYVEITAAAFRLEDWVTVGGPESYIKKIYREGTEDERFVVIPQSTGSQDHYIQSNPIPLHQNDKFDFGVDWRIGFNATGADASARILVAQIRLYGDNGANYTLTNVDSADERPGDWIPTNSTFTVNPRFIEDSVNYNRVDEREFQSVSAKARPLPVSGDIVVLIREFSQFMKTETHISNLRFDYSPLINGSYKKFEGQTNTVSRTGDYRAKLEEEVFVSDSPKKLFKGALFDFNFLTGKYFLAGQWFNAAVPFIRGLGGTDPQYNHPLSRIQAFSVWNQYRRNMRHFEANLHGGTGGAISTAVAYTGSASFFQRRVTIPGNRTDIFSAGQTIIITASTNNNGTYTLQNVFFNGASTVLTVAATFITEAKTVTISKYITIAELPDLMHSYFIQDNSPHTNGKRFMLLHYEMNLYTAEWSGFFAEVFDDNIGKAYNDTFTFKYISD